MVRDVSTVSEYTNRNQELQHTCINGCIRLDGARNADSSWTRYVSIQATYDAACLCP
jgi:hypothetical protein